MGKQKRSPNTYQKIDTIFKRDANNCIMPYDGFVSDELEWLRNCKFDAEEKIDGTCMRIEVTGEITYGTTPISNTEYETDYDCPLYIDWTVEFRGKTDSASIPKMLDKYLHDTYPADKVLAALGLKAHMQIAESTLVDGKVVATQEAIDKKWVVINNDGSLSNTPDVSRIPRKYTLYGEGYGAGIQSGGYYRKDNSYIGFDVKVDDMYLLREQRDDIFKKLGCDIVPFIGQFTIDEAIEFVKKGFNSRIATDEHLAEGLVLRSPMGIKNRRGERIIFKVKTCDFVKRFNKYGTDGPCDQPENTNYKR